MGLEERLKDAEAARERIAQRERDLADAKRWMEWSDGRYPDESPGDVIDAYADGTIVLDDGVTTWNPIRACAFLAANHEGAA